MKIRITKPGLYGQGPIPVGAEFNVKGAPPAGWAGKYEVIADDPAPEAEAVVAEDPAPEADDDDAPAKRRGRPRKEG